MNRPAIISFGEVHWDLFPEGARFGGAPANFACHAALLGGDVTMVSAVGDDARGHEAIRILGTYGIVQLSLDGKNVGEPVDCYDQNVTTAGEISLGKHDLKVGKHPLRATLVGSNPNTRDTAKVGTYVFGLDYLRVANP